MRQHSLGSKSGKRVEVGKIFIPMRNITELNELIYTGTKQVCNKIDVSLRNLNSNSKAEYRPVGWGGGSVE